MITDANSLGSETENELVERLYKLLRDVQVVHGGREAFAAIHQELFGCPPSRISHDQPVIPAVIAAGIYGRLRQIAQGHEELYAMQAALNDEENEWRVSAKLPLRSDD